MLRREPRSVSGLVNLDEAGGVSMMSTGAAHQRMLLGPTVTNIEVAGKLIRAEPRIATREIQESLSFGTAATMSVL